MTSARNSRLACHSVMSKDVKSSLNDVIKKWAYIWIIKVYADWLLTRGCPSPLAHPCGGASNQTVVHISLKQNYLLESCICLTDGWTYPLTASHAIITPIVVWLAIKHGRVSTLIINLVIIVQANTRVAGCVKSPLN